MSSWPLVAIGFAFLASCATGWASGYLIFLLRQLAPNLQKKLLARQIFHLAFADLIFAVGEAFGAFMDFVAVWLWQHGETPLRDKTLDVICNVSFNLLEFGRRASLIFECHLALTFAASIFKNTCLLDVLSRCLPLVYCLALLMCILSFIFTRQYWIVDEYGACDSDGAFLIFPIIALVTFVVCLWCYATSACRVYSAAGVGVQRSVWCRAQCYLLVALVFIMPYAVCNILDGLGVMSDSMSFVVWNITRTLYNCNGCFNYIVYVMQSRHARRLYSDRASQPLSDGEGQQYSFRVGFRSADSLLEVEYQSEPRFAIIARGRGRMEGIDLDINDAASGYFTEIFNKAIEGNEDVSQDVGEPPKCQTCVRDMMWSSNTPEAPCGFCLASVSAFGNSAHWICKGCCYQLCVECGKVSRALEVIKEAQAEPQEAQAPHEQIDCKEDDSVDRQDPAHPRGISLSLLGSSRDESLAETWANG